MCRTRTKKTKKSHRAKVGLWASVPNPQKKPNTPPLMFLSCPSLLLYLLPLVLSANVPGGRWFGECARPSQVPSTRFHPALTQPVFTQKNNRKYLNPHQPTESVLRDRCSLRV